MSDPQRLDQKAFSRLLRKAPTPAEKALWTELRQGDLRAYRFGRQVPVGAFIADFCSRGVKVVVEVDGESHDKRIEEDAARDESMEKLGYAVLRFTNDEVFQHSARVVSAILEVCEARPRHRY